MARRLASIGVALTLGACGATVEAPATARNEGRSGCERCKIELYWCPALREAPSSAAERASCETRYSECVSACDAEPARTP